MIDSRLFSSTRRRRLTSVYGLEKAPDDARAPEMEPQVRTLLTHLYAEADLVMVLEAQVGHLQTDR